MNGRNVGIACCEICGHEWGVSHGGLRVYEGRCATCDEAWMRGGVFLIEIDQTKEMRDDEPFRTGRIVCIAQEAVVECIPGIGEERVVFVEIGVIERLFPNGLPSELRA